MTESRVLIKKKGIRYSENYFWQKKKKCTLVAGGRSSVSNWKEVITAAEAGRKEAGTKKRFPNYAFIKTSLISVRSCCLYSLQTGRRHCFPLEKVFWVI